MIDALWIAASGVEYARTVGNLYGPDEFVFEFYVDRHPCDDQPYVADLRVVGSGWRITEQFDGSGCGPVGSKAPADPSPHCHGSPGSPESL